MEERLKEILDNHSKAIEEAAKEIIGELKAKTKTYKELERELNKFERGMSWEQIDRQQYQSLLSEIKRMIAAEKDSLPIKNCTRVITIKLDIEQTKKIDDLTKVLDTFKNFKRVGVIE